MWLHTFVIVVCLSDTCLNFPLQSCKTAKNEVVIHTASINNLQKVRIQNIVGLFLNESENGFMKSKIAIFLTSNMTQPLIGFNSYNSSSELLQKVSNLNNSLERQVQVIETIQENSIRYFQENGKKDAASHVVIILCEFCNDIAIDYLNKTYIETYIIGVTIFERVSIELQSMLNQAIISLSDDLSDNLHFTLSLCGQCSVDWVAFDNKANTNELHCFKLEKANSLVNCIKTMDRCNALGAVDYYKEGVEEFKWLLHMVTHLLIDRLNNSNTGSYTFLSSRHSVNNVYCEAFTLFFNKSMEHMQRTLVSIFINFANLVVCKYSLLNTDVNENDDLINILVGSNMNYLDFNVRLFHCDNKQSIPYTFLHDEFPDCDNAIDTIQDGKVFMTLYMQKIKDIGFPRCLETTLSDGTCLPSQWFYNDENYHFYKPRRYKAISYDKIRQVEDMLASCNETECKLEEHPHIHVVRGKDESKFGWIPKCVLQYRNEGTPEDCDDFVCPDGFFKCPRSYCIQYHMIFDNLVHCNHYFEDDVSVRNQIFSPKLFQCREPSTLIHPAYVCDGKFHCRFGDDELHCYEKCPSGFTCRFGVTEVTDHSNVNHTHLFELIDPSTRVLVLSGLNLTQVVFSKLDSLISLVELHLSNCSLNTIMFINLQKAIQHATDNLTFIDLSYNYLNIDTIPENMMAIEVLNLSHTKVHTFNFAVKYSQIKVVDFSFSELNSFSIASLTKNNIEINYLNLSHTHLQHISISNSTHLTIHTLDLRNTKLNFDQKTANFLKSITFKLSIYGDSYKLCCPTFSGPNVQNTNCFAPDDPVSSCDHLVGDFAKRVLLWLIGLVGFLCNVTVIIIKFVNSNNSQNKCLYFHININFSDLIMAVYVMLIAGADVYYRDDYVLYDNGWRDRSLCKAAGFLATLSYLASGVFGCLVTLQIYFTHKHSTAERQIPTFSFVTSCFVSWGFCIVISLLPVLFPDWQVYSTNSMCIGLPVAMTNFAGWFFSLSIYSLTTFVGNVFKIIGLMLTFKVIFFDGCFVESELERSKCLSLIILSKIFCGSIVSIVSLFSAVGLDISPNRMGWVPVFVMPINSAVNPLLEIRQIITKKIGSF